MRHLILTETEIRTPAIKTARFLKPFSRLPRNEGIEEHLVHRLAIIEPATPAKLLVAAYASEINRAEAVGYVWKLIGEWRIEADLDLPVMMEMPIWVDTEGGVAADGSLRLAANRPEGRRGPGPPVRSPIELVQGQAMSHQGKFLYFGPGAIVACDGRTYRVDKVLDHATLLGQDVATNEWTHLKPSRLSPPPADQPAPAVPDLVTHGPAYDVAQRRYQAIKPLVDNVPRTTAAVAEAAKAAGVSRATLYDWLRLYEDSPQLSSLIPATRGPDRGGRKLDPRIEAIIEAAMLKKHRTKQMRRVTETVAEVGSVSHGCSPL